MESDVSYLPDYNDFITFLLYTKISNISILDIYPLTQTSRWTFENVSTYFASLDHSTEVMNSYTKAEYFHLSTYGLQSYCFPAGVFPFNMLGLTLTSYSFKGDGFVEIQLNPVSWTSTFHIITFSFGLIHLKFCSKWFLVTSL